MGKVIMAGIVPLATAPVPPPPAVTGFTVTGSGTSATLSWTNPDEFHQITVTQKAGSAPTSPSDGEQIYIGTGTSTTVTGLSADTTYYWAVFAMNDNASYVSGFPTGSYTTPAEIYFYNAGDQCTDITGGWSVSKRHTDSHSGYTAASTDSNGTLYINATSGNHYGEINYVFMATVNKIDVTDLSTITVIVTSADYYTHYNADSDSYGYIGLATSRTADPSSSARLSNPTKGTRTINVSSLTGEYYIVLVVGSSCSGSEDEGCTAQFNVSQIKGI